MRFHGYLEQAPVALWVLLAVPVYAHGTRFGTPACIDDGNVRAAQIRNREPLGNRQGRYAWRHIRGEHIPVTAGPADAV